jgi:prevent-host-death family protein
MRCTVRQFTATEAKQRLSELLDAAQREPVVIRRQKRDIAVVMSPREYDRLRAVNIAEFERVCDQISAEAVRRGLTEKKLKALLADGD